MTSMQEEGPHSAALSGGLFSGMKANAVTAEIVFHDYENRPIPAGANVHGTVSLNIGQESVDCFSVSCSIVGQESTELISEEPSVPSHNSHSAPKITVREEVSILNIKQTLEQIPIGNILKGKYEYPFTFVIPETAPASLKAGAQQDYCAVEYHMEVSLDRSGSLRSSINCKKSFDVIRAAPESSNTPLVLEPAGVDLYTMGLFKRGTIFIGGAVDGTAFCSGREARLKYAVLNCSSVTIEAIEFKLQETMAFTAHRHARQVNSVLHEQRLTANEIPLNLHQFVRPAEHTAGSEAGQEELAELRRRLESDSSPSITFTMPETAHATYSGTLIRVLHTLTMTVVTAFGTDNVVYTRGLQVYNGSCAPASCPKITESASK